LNDEGFIIIPKDGKNFKITKEYLEERQSVNRQEMLSRIKCPVLIIHGDADDTLPLQDSKDAIQYLSEDSKLEVIEGAGHKLEEHLDGVIDLSVNWFKRYLR